MDGDIVPRKWDGRVMAFLAMLIGIGFFGWAIAQLSSAITLQKLHSDITHHRDLRNKMVWVLLTTNPSRINKISILKITNASYR